MSTHCKHKGRDRGLGTLGELGFARVCIDHGKTVMLIQGDRKTSAQAYYNNASGQTRRIIMPDVRDIGCNEEHEIKVKNPFVDGTYGLEVYRFESLVELATRSRGSVRFTIFDWEEAGYFDSNDVLEAFEGLPIRDTIFARIKFWRSASVSVLHRRWVKRRPVKTYCGNSVLYRDCYFWPVGLWTPLSEVWATPEAAA